jgi:flagellar capping protein FliD
MATFESITWQAAGVIAVMLSALATAVVWTYNKVYGFGRTDERINNIEHMLEVEYRDTIKAIDERFNRIDERFDRLEDRMEKRFKMIDDKFDKLYDLLLKKQ